MQAPQLLCAITAHRDGYCVRFIPPCESMNLPAVAGLPPVSTRHILTARRCFSLFLGWILIFEFQFFGYRFVSELCALGCFQLILELWYFGFILWKGFGGQFSSVFPLFLMSFGVFGGVRKWRRYEFRSLSAQRTGSRAF